jgi:hypothetical protein
VEESVPYPATIIAIAGAVLAGLGLVWLVVGRSSRLHLILSSLCIAAGAGVYVAGLLMIDKIAEASPPVAESKPRGIKELAIPVDKFPLQGYRLSIDAPAMETQASWEREFQSIAPNAAYGFINVRLFVISDAKGYVDGDDCSFAPAPGGRMPLTSGPSQPLWWGKPPKHASTRLTAVDGP